jgi:hypothetical protein
LFLKHEAIMEPVTPDVLNFKNKNWGTSPARKYRIVLLVIVALFQVCSLCTLESHAQSKRNSSSVAHIQPAGFCKSFCRSGG